MFEFFSLNAGPLNKNNVLKNFARKKPAFSSELALQRSFPVVLEQILYT